MEKTRSLLFNILPCEDGVLPFHREVLFNTCGRWMADRLASLGAVTVLTREPGDFGSAEVRLVGPQDDPFRLLASMSDLLDCETTILCDMPIPELSEKEFGELQFTHMAQNAVLTQMETELNDGRRPLRLLAISTSKLRRILSSTEAKNLLELAREINQDNFNTKPLLVPRVLNVCSAESAYQVQERLQSRINYAHLSRGVHFLDLGSVFISQDTLIQPGATILPGSILKNGCVIGSGAVIGPNCFLDHAQIGEQSTVNASQVLDSVVGNHTAVGPFAYVRPGCVIGDHARIGDFVELKKSSIGDNTKVSHLTYIGDATVGQRVNFGCGTVVVNYDGFGKYQTVIGDDAFIGCNTNLVAPVTVGSGAITAAGTTVTEEVPDDALAISRIRQENKLGWAKRRREFRLRNK